jgi:hypothetical protein
MGEVGDDQTVWMTTVQVGFPLTRDEEELINSKTDTQSELTSTGQSPSPLDQGDIDLENEWSQKYVTGGSRILIPESYYRKVL